MAVASPKARSTEKKAVGGVHETGRIPFFLFRVTFAGTVAGLARRAVGYIYIYIYIYTSKKIIQEQQIKQERTRTRK